MSSSVSETAQAPGAAVDRPVLSLKEIRKSYGHVEALKGVDFELLAGEVHALLGDNGAGKSTLLKIATGAVHPDSGTITFHGDQLEMESPLDARRLGIETVYQDLALSEDRSCTANIFAGREILRAGLLGYLGVLDRREMRRRATEMLRDLNVTVDNPDVIIRKLSGGQKQGVALARAAIWANHVVLLDEPTAALGVRQRQTVEQMIKRLRDRGFGVVLISHDVLEVLEIADRVTILRQGQRVATRHVSEIDLKWVVNATVGGVDSHD